MTAAACKPGYSFSLILMWTPLFFEGLLVLVTAGAIGILHRQMMAGQKMGIDDSYHTKQKHLGQQTKMTPQEELITWLRKNVPCSWFMAAAKCSPADIGGEVYEGVSAGVRSAL